MTKKQIIELYGKSAYQIRLELAIWAYQQQDGLSAEGAFLLADEFVSHMQSSEHKPLVD